MYKYVETIALPKSNGSLSVMAGATATIYVAGTSTLATLYADDEVTHLTNPLICDANGLVQCKLDNGTYDISYSNGGSTLLIPQAVKVTSAGAYDPANVAITGGTINGVDIGQNTPAKAKFTDLYWNGDSGYKA
jgi:hypothetical protein